MPQPPSDLPAILRERYARVAARLEELHVPLPPEWEESAVRVAVISDFVLGALLRYPQALLERIRDPLPLDAAAVRARLSLESATEATAMTALRRTRQIEMARIAWRDIAGLA